MTSPWGRSPRRQTGISAAEQHEFLQQQLRRNVISRRNLLKGGVSAAGAAFLLGNGSGLAFADVLGSTGTVAGGFVVNGRHLSFGDDPRRAMWVAGQLFNLNTYNAVPSGIRVAVEYGDDQAYGRTVTAEEVANTTVFLLSDKSGGMTGSTHLLDGGVGAR